MPSKGAVPATASSTGFGAGVVTPCQGCGRTRSRSAYSNSQWKKPDKRMCKECIQMQQEELKKIKGAKSNRRRNNPLYTSSSSFEMNDAKVDEEGEGYLSLEALTKGSFSTEDLEACLKVLRAVGRNSQLFFSKPLKALRQAVMPLLVMQKERLFGAPIYYLNRPALDRDIINKRELRAKRIKQLKKVMGGFNLPLIADGSVDEKEAAALAKLTDGVELETAGTNKASTIHGNPRSCYLCKSRFRKLHEFYDQFCPSCADFNWKKRIQTADLKGRVAIVTGARVKIGFRTALKLLRCGASVIVTTRFPCDAARRYKGEKDFEHWSHRLQVVGLDFRDIRAVEEFCRHLYQHAPRLDMIINNACQTIRRPSSYYKHLLDAERLPSSELDPQYLQLLKYHLALTQAILHRKHKKKLKLDGQTERPKPTSEKTEVTSRKKSQLDEKGFGWIPSYELTQAAVTEEDHLQSHSLMPEGMLDVNQQQIDLRRHNSWLLKLEEIDTAEAAEVLCINSLAPFVLNSKLKPLMMRTQGSFAQEEGNSTHIFPKFIINEGKFYRHKTANHPHTNMAKAALNMMTRTSASGYAEDSIFMNAVDTGWINDENPLEKAKKIADEHNFQTPIDEVDAAARILDPIMVAVNTGTLFFGQFLKDYKPTEW